MFQLAFTFQDTIVMVIMWYWGRKLERFGSFGGRCACVESLDPSGTLLLSCDFCCPVLAKDIKRCNQMPLLMSDCPSPSNSHPCQASRDIARDMAFVHWPLCSLDRAFFGWKHPVLFVLYFVLYPCRDSALTFQRTRVHQQWSACS